MSPNTATDQHLGTQRSDTECRDAARQFLLSVIGVLPEDLRWDETHHLQGHAHIGVHELVIIAPRDEVHRTVVLTAWDWDQVRHAVSDRLALLAELAIADRQRLEIALANDPAVLASAA